MAKPVRLTLFVDNEQLKRSLKESADATKDFGSDVQQAVGKVSTGVVAAGTFIGDVALDIVSKLASVAEAAIRYLPELGVQFDAVNDKFIAGSLNNPILNGEMQRSFRDLMPQVAAPMNDIADAVDAVAGRLGYTGTKLDDVAAQIIDVTRIMGGDLSANLAAITNALYLWNISGEEAPAIMDTLTKAASATGTDIGSIASQLDGSSLALRTLGFSMEDVIAFSAQLGRAGFTIDDFGRVFTRLIKNAEPGDDLSSLFDSFVEDIKSGVADFAEVEGELGTRGATQFFSLARDGKLEFGALKDQITGAGDGIQELEAKTSSWPDKWQQIMNRVQIALKPIAEGVTATIGEVLDILAPEGGDPTKLNFAGAWAKVAERWSAAWEENIKPALDDLWAKLVAWWQQDSTQQAIRDIGAGLASALWEGFSTGWEATFENTSDDGAWGWFKRALGFDGGLFKDAPIGLPSGADSGGSMPGGAMGISVAAGRPVMVGEHRRELFVPDTPGKVVPPHKMGAYGGGGDTFNIVAPSPQTAAAEIIRMRRKQSYLAGVA